ncbi:MAG TPA: nuclear transport factor 2 family protein [Mycobacteriales bacterium]
MDQQGARAAMQHYLDRSAAGDQDGAHEIYTRDAVLEFPQSGERFEGVPNFLEWRRGYPAEVDLELRDIRGGGDVWTAEVTVRYDGGPRNYGVSILEFRGDKVARETIYYAEAFEAPAWRARWRAAPAGPAGDAG